MASYLGGTRFVLATLAATAARAFASDEPRLAPVISLDVGGGVAMEFVLIPAGRFVMGSDPQWAEHDETPPHEVTLTHPFYLGKYEVTQEQWRAVMGTEPSHFKGARRPVESVSWNDCQAFLARLASLTHRRYALPTEAQWEYACRAGSSARWCWGEDESLLPQFGWVRRNAANQTHRIGEKRPNRWDLHDMYGNVWEWCADWYASAYPAGPATDPTGPVTGEARVVRGGAWGDDGSMARSAYRNSMGPDIRNLGTGFRCVLLATSSPLGGADTSVVGQN